MRFLLPVAGLFVVAWPAQAQEVPHPPDTGAPATDAPAAADPNAVEIPQAPPSYGGPQPVEEEEPEGPNPLELSTYLIQVTAALSAPPDTDFEDTLRTHGYGDSDIAFGAEVDVRFRLISFWWIGGRLALRERSWERFRGNPTSAFVVSGLLVTGVRFSANPVLDLGVIGGVGLGPLMLTMEEGTDGHFLFHAHGAAEVGFTISGPVRGMVRVGYDFASAIVNQYDHSLEMGGLTISTGLEAQL